MDEEYNALSELLTAAEKVSVYPLISKSIGIESLIKRTNLQMAELLSTNGEHEKAINKYQEISNQTSNPMENALIELDIALVYVRAKQYQKASDVYKSVITTFSTHPAIKSLIPKLKIYRLLCDLMAGNSPDIKGLQYEQIVTDILAHKRPSKQYYSNYDPEFIELIEKLTT